MLRFRNLSIRSKLNCLAAFAAGLALVLAGTTLAVNEFVSGRQETVRHVSAIADVVGANCTAALTFDDADDAAQVLSSLGLEPSVRRALLFDRQRQVVAHYRRNDVPASFELPLLRAVGHKFNNDGHLEVFQTILDTDGLVGTLYIEAGTERLTAMLTRNLMLLVVVLAISLGAALVFSSRIRQIISVPITTLATAAQRISNQRDYSIRVEKVTEDEIGLLYDQFNHMLSRIQASERELRDAHDDLAAKVKETSEKNDELNREVSVRLNAEHELRELQQRYVEAAHQAGKAEVASSVLHNVGNVLTSVNVSAGLIADNVRALGVDDLGRAANLVREHDDDLSSYVTEDSCGKHLPQFLNDLSRHMASGEQSLLAEVKSLTMNVEHIKDIVSVQQSHACASGFIQDVSLREVIDDAVRINGASMDRHRVRVVRELEELPTTALDRQKLLQILVNLVSNAKYALIHHNQNAERRITIRLRRVGDDRTRIEVADNGVGIAAENLNRIFSHGFTTRKEGHGFGLHSAALAAAELGGGLTALSDGKGTGATFVLELPLETAAPTHSERVVVPDSIRSENAAASPICGSLSPGRT